MMPTGTQDSRIAGRTRAHTHSQCRTVSSKKKDQVEEPFPVKPVPHRRQTQTQVLFGLHDYEKITPSTQQRGHVMHQEYHSAGIRETRPLPSELPSEEQLMNRAIQEKELLLLEKLWKVGEKVKAIQISSSDPTAGHDHKRGDGKHDVGLAEWGEVLGKPMVSEHRRRELLYSRDVLLDESFYDLKQRKTQDQMTEDGFRNKYEVQQFRWDVSKHETEGEPRKGKLQNEPFRRRDGKIYDWEEMDERYRKLNEASHRNTSWTREKEYKESMHSSGDKQNTPEKIVQKPKQALANQRSTILPRLPLHSSLQQQVEPELIDAAAGSFQHLPCNLCNRMFQSERLEKHIQICAKVNLKHRPVFNSSTQRSKGSQMEEYLKTHVRSKTPEVLKKKRNRKKT